MTLGELNELARLLWEHSHKIESEYFDGRFRVIGLIFWVAGSGGGMHRIWLPATPKSWESWRDTNVMIYDGGSYRAGPWDDPLRDLLILLRCIAADAEEAKAKAEEAKKKAEAKAKDDAIAQWEATATARTAATIDGYRASRKSE